jgi:P-type Cu2+ transporter
MQQGLERYYTLGKGEPVSLSTEPHDSLWLEPILQSLVRAKGLMRIDLRVQGLHCSACVWLFQELFARTHAPGHVVVNSSTGVCRLVIGASFPLAQYLADLEQLGYRLGPITASENAASSDLLWRMGVAIAIAMNTMIFAIPDYAVLPQGRLFDIFATLNFVLSGVSVAIGGPVFFRSALGMLRRRVFHLDVPISVGIALAFASSAHGYFTRSGDALYFDTLNVFIALMLVGRFLRERAVARNRTYLLQSDGAESLLTRRLCNERGVQVVPCTSLRAGDTLYLAPGDLVPVSAELIDDSAPFSKEWISGECDPEFVEKGGAIAAGAFLKGDAPRRARCTEDFEASTLRTLLRVVPEPPEAARFWQLFAKTYVVLMLALAVATFAVWSTMGTLAAAFRVVTGLLIVTCPCAFGIATPLAYELAHAGLRRRGLFVRRAGFLDRALAVRRIVFDKTGTLTTGVMQVRQVQGTLSPTQRDLAYNMAARSSHPKAAAIAKFLAEQGAIFDGALLCREIPGSGVELVDGSARLGRGAWCGGAAGEHDVWFAIGNEAVCAFDTEETLRPNAADDLAALAKEYTVSILTGDRRARALAVAAHFGVPEHDVIAGCSPEGKADWLRGHDAAHTLVIGDGVNDAPALHVAHCAGTPAIDLPYVASGSDFFFTTPGLGAVRLMLAVAAKLRRVVLRNLVVGTLYNVLAISLAVTGNMTPLLCALVMPLSSLSLVLSSTHSLAEGGRVWKS